MFNVIRFFYPNGNEGESMDNTVKEFDTMNRAIEYCHRYAKGTRFAGVVIEDANGKMLYEITSDGDVNDYRKKILVKAFKKEIQNVLEFIGKDLELIYECLDDDFNDNGYYSLCSQNVYKDSFDGIWIFEFEEWSSKKFDYKYIYLFDSTLNSLKNINV